ncbi:pre-mRNA-processing factor 17-like [Paramacrobiotus metropolitanus]|uniref:pre-mRNA-processing factor 17-like n=1 Tax=Paramacrobiotus metropolitanus TaxID=2943436 RepID=UPI0024464E3F|nr:pre-mRNA-processing factor 17-like [Paramacrobiotus metropolitanus]
MSALRALHMYDDDETEGSSSAEQSSSFAAPSKVLSLTVESAPIVKYKNEGKSSTIVRSQTKELQYNAKFDDVYAPNIGPENPFLSAQQKAPKNTLTGFVEPAVVSGFQFEMQRRSFAQLGYALDPSLSDGTKIIGNVGEAERRKGATIIDVEKTKLTRKRARNDNAEDLDNFQGPWAGFEDETTTSKPSAEDMEEIQEFLAKKKRRQRTHEEKPLEETSQLHIKNAYDYMGRSFLHIPQDVGVNLRSEEAPDKCYIPKNLLHTWAGHNRGVAAIRWFPKSGHLLLSAGMDTKVKLWQVYGDRECVRSYVGHRQAVRDVNFNNTGTQFLSSAYDRWIKLWDTEKGDCIGRFQSPAKKTAYCVKFHPDEDKQHLFVCGMQDKKILCWDTRSGEMVQEYDRHLGAVNTITFIDDNRRFISTSDDKSVRVWEWDIPVDMKYIADPGMHSMPAVTQAPNGKWCAMQAMDNKLMIFSCLNRYKFNRKKTFGGHMVAGYACQPDFSPDMSYILSGDANGNIWIWDWKTTRILSKWKGHEKCCISVLWHPHETSKIVSCGWDGAIKLWD